MSRPLFFYVKKAHLGVIPGLKEYVEFFLDDQMVGPDSPLAEYGLVAAPDASVRPARRLRLRKSNVMRCRDRALARVPGTLIRVQAAFSAETFRGSRAMPLIYVAAIVLAIAFVRLRRRPQPSRRAGVRAPPSSTPALPTTARGHPFWRRCPPFSSSSSGFRLNVYVHARIDSQLPAQTAESAIASRDLALGLVKSLPTACASWTPRESTSCRRPSPRFSRAHRQGRGPGSGHPGLHAAIALEANRTADTLGPSAPALLSCWRWAARRWGVSQVTAALPRRNNVRAPSRCGRCSAPR